MAFLLSYTRKEIDSVFYDARLAFSLHLAVSKDGKNFVALNQLLSCCLLINIQV